MKAGNINPFCFNRAIIIDHYTAYREQIRAELTRANIEIIGSVAELPFAIDIAKQEEGCDLVICPAKPKDHPPIEVYRALQKYMDFEQNSHFFISYTDEYLNRIDGLLSSIDITGVVRKPIANQTFTNLLYDLRKSFISLQGNKILLHAHGAAQFYLSVKKYDKALEIFKNISKEYKSGLIFFKIGQIHAMINEKEKAIQYFSKAVQQEKYLLSDIDRFIDENMTPQSFPNPTFQIDQPHQGSLKALGIPIEPTKKKFFQEYRIKTCLICSVEMQKRDRLQQMIKETAISYVHETGSLDKMLGLIGKIETDLLLIDLDNTHQDLMLWIQRVRENQHGKDIYILAFGDKNMKSFGNKLQKAFEAGIDWFTPERIELETLIVALNDMMIHRHLGVKTALAKPLIKFTACLYNLKRFEEALNIAEMTDSVSFLEEPVCLLYRAMCFHQQEQISTAQAAYGDIISNYPEFHDVTVRMNRTIDKEIRDRKNKTLASHKQKKVALEGIKNEDEHILSLLDQLTSDPSKLGSITDLPGSEKMKREMSTAPIRMTPNTPQRLHHWSSPQELTNKVAPGGVQVNFAESSHTVTSTESQSNSQNLQQTAIDLVSQASLCNARLMTAKNIDFSDSMKKYLIDMAKIGLQEAIWNLLEIPDETMKELKAKKQLLAKDPTNITLKEDFGLFLVNHGISEQILSKLEQFWQDPNNNDSSDKIAFKKATSAIQNSTLSTHKELFENYQQFNSGYQDVANSKILSESDMNQLNHLLKTDSLSIESFCKIYNILNKRSSEDDVRNFVNAHIPHYITKKSAADQLAQFFLDSKDYQSAYLILKHLIHSEPHNITYKKNFCLTALKTNHLKEAIEEAEKLIKINPSYIDAYNMIGIAFKKSKKPKSAIKYYKEGLRFDNKNPKLYFNLALAYLANGQKKESLKYYKKCMLLTRPLRQNPGNESIAGEELK